VSAVLDRAEWKAARALPTVDAHVDFDPLQFASRLDIVATVTTILGVVLCAGGVIWVLASTVGGGFDYHTYGNGGRPENYQRIWSFMAVVPSLAFFMFGWYAFEVAAGLRRFRPNARLAHGTLVLALSPVLAPFSILSWLWLHSFRPRIYYDARARGLDAQQAVSSIEEVTYRHPDAPLTGSSYSVPGTSRDSWWGLLGSALVAAALIGGWVAMSNTFVGGRALSFGFYSQLASLERMMIWIGAAGIAWLVAVGPRVYRTGLRGPVYALVGSAIFTVVASIGLGAMLDAMRESAHAR
jgi:hypothetical protein